MCISSHQYDGVPIGRGLDQHFIADDRVAAGAILDDYRLPQLSVSFGPSNRANGSMLPRARRER